MKVLYNRMCLQVHCGTIDWVCKFQAVVALGVNGGSYGVRHGRLAVIVRASSAALFVPCWFPSAASPPYVFAQAPSSPSREGEDHDLSILRWDCCLLL